MKFETKNPPRKFTVGLNHQIEIKDCARIMLEPNEQVTFIDSGGGQYDVACKEWGFYATPSINGRLLNEGFKTALVKNSQSRYYIMLVAKSRIKAFEAYLAEEKQEVVEWLDERPSKY